MDEASGASFMLKSTLLFENPENTTNMAIQQTVCINKYSLIHFVRSEAGCNTINPFYTVKTLNETDLINLLKCTFCHSK